MLFFAQFYGMFMASSFKNFGCIEGDIDDFTLTIAGSIGSFFNGFGRLFWALLQDRFGFKKIYLIVLTIQVGVSASIFFIVTVNKYLYVVWVATSFICLAGNFSMIPTATS